MKNGPCPHWTTSGSLTPEFKKEYSVSPSHLYWGQNVGYVFLREPTPTNTRGSGWPIYVLSRSNRIAGLGENRVKEGLARTSALDKHDGTHLQSRGSTVRLHDVPDTEPFLYPEGAPNSYKMHLVCQEQCRGQKPHQATPKHT